MLRATIPTEARAILQLVKSAGRRVHVAFEEGTQAQWLHDLVVAHAEKVIVCNTRGRAESGNKNDRLDAEELSERLRLGSLRPVFQIQLINVCIDESDRVIGGNVVVENFREERLLVAPCDLR